MKRILIILLLVLLKSSNILCYSFNNGFIVMPNNDTIKGYINNKSDESLSFGIEFKIDLNCDTFIKYSPGQIKSFGFSESKKSYFAVDYVYRKDTLQISYIRFGLLIYNGKTTLYKLEIPMEEQNYTYEMSKSYSYIIQKSNKLYTLSQSEEVKKIEDKSLSYYKGREFHVTHTIPVLHKYYKGVLSYLLNDCPSLQPIINNLEFNDKSILKLLKKYDNCNQ